MKRGRELAQQDAAGQLRAGCVDRDTGGLRPGHRFGAGGLGRPCAERDDEVALLGQGDEAGGGIMPRRRCGQRARASAAAIARVCRQVLGWKLRTSCRAEIALARSARSRSSSAGRDDGLADLEQVARRSRSARFRGDRARSRRWSRASGWRASRSRCGSTTRSGRRRRRADWTGTSRPPCSISDDRGWPARACGGLTFPPWASPDGAWTY